VITLALPDTQERVAIEGSADDGHLVMLEKPSKPNKLLAGFLPKAAFGSTK
jgi:hypothetical protein